MWRTAASGAARVSRLVLAASVLTVALPMAGVAQARGLSWGVEPATVAVAELPSQGQHTYRLILQGGPFPHDKDGSVFGNRERLLPRKARGFYREYTVRTPGLSHRGARRIVCGGEVPRAPEVCYYTADHYARFRVITGSK